MDSPAEQKYRRAMSSNAQLHAERAALIYQVETLREELNMMEEELWELRRSSDENKKALEQQIKIQQMIQAQRDRLQDELENLQKTHGEINQGDVEGHLSTETGLTSAESNQGNKESILGKCGVCWKQSDDGRVYKRSQSLVIFSTRDPPGQSGERDHTAGINQSGCKLMRERDPKNRTTEKELDYKCTHRDCNIKLQPTDNAGAVTPERNFKDKTTFEFVSASNPSKTMSPVITASAKKVIKSRLVPPRPAKEIRLLNKTILFGYLSAEKDTPPGEELENISTTKEDILSCDENLNKPKKSALVLSYRPQYKDKNMNSPEKSREYRSVPSSTTKHVQIQTSKNILRESTSLTMSTSYEAKPNSDGSGEDSVPNTGSNLVPVENTGDEETVVSTASAEAVLQNIKSVGSKVSTKGVCEHLYLETKLESHGVDVCESAGTLQKHVAREIPRPTEEQHQLCPEWAEDNLRTPREVWTNLEKTIRDKPCVEVDNEAFVTELSRIISEMQVSLNQWTLDVEQTSEKMVKSRSRMNGVSSVLVNPLYTDGEQRPTPEGPQSQNLAPMKRLTTARGNLVCEPIIISDGFRRSPCPAVSHGLLQEVVVRSTDPGYSKQDNSSEEFVLIESHFAKPLSSEEQKKIPAVSGSSNAVSSSKVRKLLESTAEEIKALAVPELILSNRHEGRLLVGPPKEVPVVDMDSCEEADEEVLMP